LAAEILSTIQEAIIHDDIMKIKAPLLVIANPITAKNSEEKEIYTNIHTKVDEASQKGNQLAATILNITDAATDKDIHQLKQQLDQAKTQGDEIASMILNTIDNTASSAPIQLQAQPPAQPAAPQANPVDPNQNYPFGMGQQNESNLQPSSPIPANFNPAQNSAPLPPINNPGPVNYNAGGAALQPDGKPQ
jgi:hypothetical protein